MQRHFYALPDDLLAILELVEARQPVRYTATKTIEASIADSYLAGTTIPTLWQPAPFDSGVAGTSYLVTPRDSEVRGRRIVLANGGIRYAFDQLNNPDTVELLTGGRHTSGAILYGRIATCTDSPISKKIFELLKGAIGKRYRRINAFWVGPNAEAAWRQGARLTQSISSPHEFDLREASTDAI